MPYLHGKFVWFEHVSTDSAKARAFYSELFGWKIEELGTGGQLYVMIRNGTKGIGGFRTGSAKHSHWMSYLSVADVDATVATASSAGATIIIPPKDFGSFGRGATLADPAGAVFSIWRGNNGDPPDAPTVPAGSWYWNECSSSHPEKALAFYEKVFGFAHQVMHHLPAPYYVLTHGGVPRAGLMQCSDPGAPSAWLPYLSVSDCDGVVARARSLGARVCVDPIDIPDVGRFAVLMDNIGAVIGVIHGTSTA